MKITIAVVAVFCLLGLSSTAQNIGRIKSAWSGAYLNIENGSLQATAIKDDWLSAQWELVKVQDGQFRIKNVWKGTFLNIENGGLQCTPVQEGFLSARWSINNITGTNAIRIFNIWKPAWLIHIEPGYPTCGPAQDGWLSARWNWEAIGNNAVANNNSANNNAPNNLVNIQELLAAHNSLRSAVGVPPLTWSVALAAKAQAWANKLAEKNRGDQWVLQHSGPAENLAGGFISADSPAQRVLRGWGDEKANFDPNTRLCISGKVCGHYTQVVWRKTTQVGCGVAVNPNGKYILVCNYDPPGNYIGEPAY